MPVAGFGECLLRLHGKRGKQWDGTNGDVSISSLGYYTDNGRVVPPIIEL